MKSVTPNHSSTNPKRLFTTFGRFNRVSPHFNEFDIEKYPKFFDPQRMQAVTLKDALVDPH